MMMTYLSLRATLIKTLAELVVSIGGLEDPPPDVVDDDDEVLDDDDLVDDDDLSLSQGDPDQNAG